MDKSWLAVGVTVAFSCLGVLGDYFLKLASASDAPLRTRWFYIGFVIYASTAFGWVFVMKHLKLATIGVFYSVAMIVLLTLVGTLGFGERLSAVEVAGILMGVGALLLLSRFG